jgi:membrane-associated protein
MSSLFDPVQLISTLKVIGYLGIFLIIFAESGLFFGFFLPGDSLLVTAGILAADHVFTFPFLLFIVITAAILGDTTGYGFGFFVGKKIFSRESSFFFRKEHLLKAQHFYTKHGPKAVVLSRFMPIVRTFVPIVAGAAFMHYKTFIRYNAIGGILWASLTLGLGYTLGKRIPDIESYIFPCILAIIVISFLPVVFGFVNEKRNSLDK